MLVALQHLGKKRSQEDFFMACGEAGKGLYMSGLFDGHGGPGTAKHASQHLQNYIAKGLQNSKGAAVPGLQAAFRWFDRWWGDAAYDPAVSANGLDNSGSTAVVSVLQGDLLTVANAGKQRAVAFTLQG
jgi:serine/threonine protein phosphatase PrpC